MKRPRPILWIVVAAALGFGCLVAVLLGGEMEAFGFYSVFALVIGVATLITCELAPRFPKLLWAVPLVTLVCGTLVIVEASDGRSMMESLVYFLGGLAFGLFTVATAVAIVIQRMRSGRTATRALPLPLLFQFLLLSFVFLAVSFDLALRVRFRLSRRAFDTAAAEIRSGARSLVPGRIGLYEVTEIDRAGDSVRFVLGDAGLDDWGVVHSLDGRPPVVAEDSYAHWQGPWWYWDRSW